MPARKHMFYIMLNQGKKNAYTPLREKDLINKALSSMRGSITFTIYTGFKMPLYRIHLAKRYFVRAGVGVEPTTFRL